MYAREDARIHRHFNTVLTELTARDVSHLDRKQRARRSSLLGVLAAYARRGLFPRNPDFAQRTPYFIDAAGTRCAMAHLIEQSGDRELVERVATVKNNAYVRELKHDLALRAWLQWSGLTAREAARIQPEYCFVTKGESCLCQSVISPEGVFEGVVTGTAAANQLTVMVQAVHGTTGTITVGSSTQIGQQQSIQVGDSVLGQVTLQQGSAQVGNVYRLEGSAVDLSCNLDVPVLDKADAIAAMFATSCAEHMTALNATWGESQCDDSPPDDGGCSAAGAGSPLVAIVAAALWVKRR